MFTQDKMLFSLMNIYEFTGSYCLMIILYYPFYNFRLLAFVRQVRLVLFVILIDFYSWFPVQFILRFYYCLTFNTISHFLISFWGSDYIDCSLYAIFKYNI
jgi:hypothetical protein